jgi:hypothetical protein
MPSRFVLAAGWAVASLAGCTHPVSFPAEPLAEAPPGLPAGAKAYDTDGDGAADFGAIAGRDGRIDRLAFLARGAARPEIVDLDSVDARQCRHLVIILDGFGFDVVKAFYDSGHLRMFHPPSRVIAPYPTLTDPSMEDLLGLAPARAFEAEYYDRGGSAVAGGANSYLGGANMPYNDALDYRAGTMDDALTYVYPRWVFRKELASIKRLFDRRQSRQLLAYIVSSAGMGTRFGAEGQREVLGQVERLVLHVLQETRGMTKVTLLADHGHSYTPATRIPLEEYLKGRGWRLSDTLRGPGDVAYIRFGLLTYASFATQSPERLAEDLAAFDGVEIATFAAGNDVVVLGPAGAAAVIGHKHGRHSYRPRQGDPLKLKGILAGLKADADGCYDANELLRATVLHEYPAPLERLWRAHFALVENPPDVIVSLADRYFSGSKTFAGFTDVASTHGGLNRGNSTTFILSSIAPLPPLLRGREVPAAMARITGESWPAKKEALR